MKKTNIFENLEYSDEKVQITLMLETEYSKEIRIVFKKNQIMKEHKTNFPICVEIIEGEINFGVNKDVHKLVKGDIVSLEPSVSHNLDAKEDSIVRLTLSKKDSVTRVNSVLKL